MKTFRNWFEPAGGGRVDGSLESLGFVDVSKLVLRLEEVVVVERTNDGFELEVDTVDDIVEPKIVVGITVDDVDELEGMLLKLEDVEVSSVLVEGLSVLPIVLKM